VRKREGSLSAWAHTCAGKYRPSAKNKNRARDFTRSIAIEGFRVTYRKARRSRNGSARKISRLDTRAVLFAS
jgi:hypothetical protein